MHVKHLTVTLTALLLVSCGGGGSSGSAPTYTIGGTVSGLAGSGLALQNNGSTLAVAANGSFSFPGAVGANGSYAVTVSSQPSSPTQTCAVANGTGVVSNANITNISISCTNSYAIGGTASGVDGKGLTLQVNAANDVAVTGDGPFTFAALPSGTAYTITVKTQPSSPRQTCTITNGTGTLGDAAVTNVTVSCRTLVSRFVYVPNRGSNNISAYAINPNTGALSAIVGSPFPSDETPGGLTADTSNNFLYASNTSPTSAVPPSISAYAIDNSTGALIEVSGSPFALPGSAPSSLQSAMVFAPRGPFVYVTAFLPGTVSVFGFSTDSTNGSLTSIPGSPFTVTASSNTLSSGIFDASGTHFYVPFGTAGGSVRTFNVNPTSGVLSTNSSTAAPTGGSYPSSIDGHPSTKYFYVPDIVANNIAAFSVDANTGGLNAVGGSPFATGGTFPILVAVHPSGRFVYTANNNNLVTPAVSGSIAAFTVDSTTGALSPIAGSPFSTQGMSATSGPVLDPSICRLDVHGRFLFVNNTSTDSIAVFSINQTTGALTAVPGSPFATASKPGFPGLDASGKYLYVANRGANTISSYAIDQSTGALTLVDSVATGSSPATLITVIGLQ